MGRKPKASKVMEDLQMPESANPALETEIPHPQLSANGALARETAQPEIQTNPRYLSYSRKNAKNQNVVVRRSGRLRSIFRSAQTNGEKNVIELIVNSESEKEDEPQIYEQEENLLPPSPPHGNTSFEEKLDSVLKSQKETLEALKSRGPKKSSTSQGPCQTDIQYRSLYFESQKKIETLTDENIKLNNKVENALGKLEVYEKLPHILSETLEKLKDVIMISHMSKATEAAINLSSQAIRDGVPSPEAKTSQAAKRKKW